MQYSVVSHNTISHLALHDCYCARLQKRGNALLWDMEWMGVLPGHPDNPFPQACRSGEGVIELHSPCLLGAQVEEYHPNAPRPPAPRAVEEVDLFNLEILTFEEKTVTGGYEAKAFFELHDTLPGFWLMTLTLFYTESVVMWNQLDRVSWCEGEQ